MNPLKDIVVVLTKPLITPGKEGLRTYQAGDRYQCPLDKAYQLVKNGDATYPHGFEILAELYFEHVADLYQEIKNKENIDTLKADFERLETKVQNYKNTTEHLLKDIRLCKIFIGLIISVLVIYTSFIVTNWWMTNYNV